MGFIFFAIIAVAIGLVVVDVVVKRRRGPALLWGVAAGVVLLAGGIVQAAAAGGPWPVITLVLGAVCLTMSDRAADAE